MVPATKELALYYLTTMIGDLMELRFEAPRGQECGLIASLLKQSYAVLIEAEPEVWGPEVLKWERFDADVFSHPETIGAAVFLSKVGNTPVGFASYDPRGKPELGVIGHNCVLPEFRNQGVGRQQIREVLRRFRSMGIRQARVSTLDHPFFIPARHVYLGCGFREVSRHPWPTDPLRAVIEYTKPLDDHADDGVGRKAGRSVDARGPRRPRQ